MEPVSALFGAMAALPQCIQSAKELYDLRSRYKDASVLISAIYSESMVIAASLSQVQNLLHLDALQSKPQLLETFDRALTGCRVVYGCLEEEVRDLVAKADADELRFKDRAKFLWKEDTFKELLTQIRGQQSALSLLIQGLQMESIADIRRLVEENSVTLDQVVKRSRTLRQSHPHVHVPESLFKPETTTREYADAESITKCAEFTFDDEVVNSRAYRKAMALYTSNVGSKDPQLAGEDELQDKPPAYEPLTLTVDSSEKLSSAIDDALNKNTEGEASIVKRPTATQTSPTDQSQPDDLGDAFESVEKNYLPYMPRVTSTAPFLTPLRATTSNVATAQSSSMQVQVPLRSYERNLLPACEEAPPLPPRRPSRPRVSSGVLISQTTKARTQSFDDDTDASTAPSIFSKVSTSSSATTHEPAVPTSVVFRKPPREPLPLKKQFSRDMIGTSGRALSVSEFNTSVSSLRNSEMHSIWLSLIQSERNFVERMSKFRMMFYNNVIRSWPNLEKHIEAIVVGEQLAAINSELLLSVMESQILQDEDGVCDPSMFEKYSRNANKAHREYSQKMPHAMSSLRATQTMDPKFGPFVNTVGLSLAWFGMGWDDYLKLPILQLEVYVEGLQSLCGITESLDGPAAIREAGRLRRAAEAMQWLRTLCSGILEGAQNRENIQDLEKRIHTPDSSILSQLRLRDSDRCIKHQGSMAIRLKSQGSWQLVHVMLLDNFLIWGKLKPRKKAKGDKVVVLDNPIATSNLEVTASCEQHQFQKATMFDDIPRGSLVYTIAIGDRSLNSKPHLLGALGYQEQKEWLEHLTAVTTVYETRT